MYPSLPDKGFTVQLHQNILPYYSSIRLPEQAPSQFSQNILNYHSNQTNISFCTKPLHQMDLGEKLQAAEVAIGAIGVLITSIGTYMAWHTAKGMLTYNAFPMLLLGF